MSAHADELALLRAANPAPVQQDRGWTPTATATLAGILQEPVDDPTESAAGLTRSRARRPGRRTLTRSYGRLILVFAAIVTAGGAALAATDPLGWWSANPTDAKYGYDPAVHVRTPTAQLIACTRAGGMLRCSPASYDPLSNVELVNGHRSTAQTYTFMDAIRPAAQGFTRSALLAVIAQQRKAGTMIDAQAARLRADIAAAPDSFFTEFQLASRYGTYGVGGETRNGLTLVPPPGIPSVVVCEPAGRGLACRDLNGDQNAPVGAGVYGALSTRSWRYERVPRENGYLPPGISFTPAEYQVLADILRLSGPQTSGPVSGKATGIPPPQPQRRVGG